MRRHMTAAEYERKRSEEGRSWLKRLSVASIVEITVKTQLQSGCAGACPSEFGVNA